MADKDYSSAYMSETATIEVGIGGNKQVYRVHRDLLSFYSGYFKAALYGGFAEGETGVIKLETEEPAVIEGFVKWIYTGKARTDEIARDNSASYYISIVKLWLFADHREIPLLMNEMIDSLHQSVVTAWTLPDPTIEEVYANTTAGSALRRMVVDVFVSLAGKSVAESIVVDSKNYSKEFLVDWIASMIAAHPRNPPLSKEQYKLVEICPRFHLHEEGAKCPKK